MRALLSGYVLVVMVLLVGCDKVKEIEKQITGEEKQKTEAKSGDGNQTDAGSQTTSPKGGSDIVGTDSDSEVPANSVTSSDTGPSDGTPKRPAGPSFPNLPAAERSAAEALARLGAELRIENDVVTEVSLRGNGSDVPMDQLLKLEHLKLLDLSGRETSDGSLKGIAGLQNLEFIDVSTSQVTNATFFEVLKIPSISFMVFDNTSIGEDALNSLLRDRRTLTLSLRGMSIVFRDEVVLNASKSLRGRVTFVTDSGVLPAKIVKYPTVGGVQTGNLEGTDF
jgi:hypothetical protein